MFFIFPLSHENQEARRWPILTMLIILLCSFAYIATMLSGGSGERAAQSAAREVIAFQTAHPYLSVKCKGVALEATPEAPTEELAPSTIDDQQAELDQLCDAFDLATESLPSFAYGDIPARGGTLTLFTHQFLHGGVLHLIFNMWFLWLCGTNLEDRWGRVLFTGFYLASGVAGALMHRAMSPDAYVPLIGASGAIAGAMGAFLVTLGATRITFFYAMWISFKPKLGTFHAHAYVMLPLWLASELLWGFLTPSDGTAHWAHVGGFAFGATIALGFKLTGIDAKLDAMADKRITTVQDPRLLQAMEHTDEGRIAEAFVALGALTRERPDDIDVWLEMLRAATAAKDAPRRLASYLRLIELYVAHDSAGTAAELLEELRLHGLTPAIPRAELLRIGELFARKSQPTAAMVCFAGAHASGLIDAPSVRAAVMHAMLLARMNRVLDAERLLVEARQSPFVTADLQPKIEAQLLSVRR